MITQDQLKDVIERADALHRYLDIDKKKMEYEEEDLRTQAPDFWEDRKRAEEQMKKVKGIKKWIDGYNEVRLMADELQLAFDFYKDEMVTEAEVDEAYLKAIAAIEDLELKNRFGTNSQVNKWKQMPQNAARNRRGRHCGRERIPPRMFRQA